MCCCRKNIKNISNILGIKQRVIIANLIKSVSTMDNYVVVVEHDLSILDYIADHISCLYGDGMNKFLKNLGKTFRKDLSNYRPRINKQNSVKDKEQKMSGNYFVTDG